MPEPQKSCAVHGERQVIDYDWQETLEVVPPKLVVRRTGIPTIACPKAPECGVVEAPRRKLEAAMSLGSAARGEASETTGAAYRFGEEDLAVYGEYEL